MSKVVPKLRFKDFDKEWIRISIQELLNRKTILSHLDGNHGGLYPRNDEFTSTGVPYISANDFYDGQVKFENCKHLPNDRAAKFKKGIAKNGDVLFAHNATVGPTALLVTDLSYVILSTTATYYRCDNKNLLNKYLRLYFETKNFIQQYSRVMSQSTRNQVPITTQRTFIIALPAYPEQQKIASFLSAIDEKIQQLTRKKELLEQYKKGVMQQLFPSAGSGQSEGKIRFKDENGRAYPKWEEKRLGEVCENIKSGRDKAADEGFFPLFGSTGRIGSSNEYSHDGSYILIARVGANAGTINLVDGKFAVSDNTLVVNCNDARSIKYVFYYLSFFNLNKLIFGSGQPLITGGQLKDLMLPLPSIEEQQKIANFLSGIDTKIESVANQIAQTQTFKKGLLQQMFV